MAKHSEAQQSGVVTVELGTIGGELKKYVLPGGSTVTDLLEKAGLPSSSEVRNTEDDEIYKDGDTVEDGDSFLAISSAKVALGLA